MWASALEVDTADCLNCAAGDVKPKGARWDDESLKRYKKAYYLAINVQRMG
jgi:hypothetical protein